MFGAFSWIAWAATMGLIIDALIKYRKGEHAVDPDAGNYTSKSRSRSRSRARSRSRKPRKARRKSSRSTSSSPPSKRTPLDQDVEMQQKQQQKHDPAAPEAVYGHPPAARSGIPTPEPGDFGGIA